MSMGVVSMLITYFNSMALKPLNDAHIFVPSPLFESVGVPFQLYQVDIRYMYFPGSVTRHEIVLHWALCVFSPF